MSIRKNLLKIFLTVMTMLFYSVVMAQGPTDSLPPDPGGSYVTITKAQDLNFGAFSSTGSGSITVTNAGVRSATGSTVLLNLGYFYYQAIFDIEAPEGTILSVMNGPDVILTGSNGGTLTLTLGQSSPASPFVTTAAPPATTQVNIGGTLTVGTSPPGNYTGTFSIIVNYQ